MYTGDTNVYCAPVKTNYPLVLALSLLGACINGPTQPTTDSGFTDGSQPRRDVGSDPTPVLQCPGESQCPCDAPAADSSGGEDDACPGPVLTCGPMGACTSNCASDDHCSSGVSGETCLGSPGHCVIVCDPSKPHGGCPKANDETQAECMLVLGAWVCGY